MVLLLALSCSLLFGGAIPPRLLLACEPANDLLAHLPAALKATRYASAAAAIGAARSGDTVMVLADSYPTTPTVLSPALFATAKARGVKLFVEFPAAVPGGAAKRANSKGPGGPTGAQDPLAPRRGPLGPSPDRGSVVRNAPALVPGPLARLYNSVRPTAQRSLGLYRPRCRA
jgi:hypothetical protein